MNQGIAKLQQQLNLQLNQVFYLIIKMYFWGNNGIQRIERRIQGALNIQPQVNSAFAHCDRIIPNFHVLISGTCEDVTLQSKKILVGVIKVKDL